MTIQVYQRIATNGGWNIPNLADTDAEGRSVPLAIRVKDALPGLPFLLEMDAVEVRFDFVDNLDTAQVATLDAVVAAHVAASGSVLEAFDEVIGRSVSALPSGLAALPVLLGIVCVDLRRASGLVARLVGRYQSDGDVLLELIEDDGSGPVTVLSQVLPSTGGASALFVADGTVALREGLVAYRAEARLAGALASVVDSLGLSLGRFSS